MPITHNIKDLEDDENPSFADSSQPQSNARPPMKPYFVHPDFKPITKIKLVEKWELAEVAFPDGNRLESVRA
jgi:hypothetical protein